MKQDYLWDRSGEPDPEIEGLENVLGRFRHGAAAPEFPLVTPRPKLRFTRSRRFWQLAAMAATVALVFVLWTVLRRPQPGIAPLKGWDVARLAGTPRVGITLLGGAEQAGKLAVGQTLQTDGQSRASVSVDDVGEVQVEPNTRLRLLESAPSRKRLALDRGTIRASIWAPAGEFTVDTPSALAVDMGCAYTLHVDDSGAGLLRTTLGWVGFRLNGHESFIPAGAACATRPGIGPGTPYFEDAPEALRAALTALDFGPAGERSAELNLILKQARTRDALTLWHLLPRVEGSDRARVYDRLAALVPPPSQVSKDGVLRLDQTMLDLWWDKLGLGDISLWRHWERSWSQHQNGDNNRP
ncbi:MAG TPA: FecR domain-containing protein [Terriglobia bacterium]|nr:FecR domain-containing protein [Terriglobia bacterium]